MQTYHRPEGDNANWHGTENTKTSLYQLIVLGSIFIILTRNQLTPIFTYLEVNTCHTVNVQEMYISAVFLPRKLREYFQKLLNRETQSGHPRITTWEEESFTAVLGFEGFSSWLASQETEYHGSRSMWLTHCLPAAEPKAQGARERIWLSVALYK